MPQQSSEQLVQCPKCSAAVTPDYQLTWCPRCNKAFPPEIKSIILARSQASQGRSTDGSESETKLESVSTLAAQVSVSVNKAPISRQAVALIQRYKDAYIVAKFVNGFGSLIKTVGIVAAIVLILGGIVTSASGRDAALAAGIVAIAFGVFVGIFSYFLGVFVSAQGQILKASLDGAVNTSPFLANEHRIEIMTLPQ
jgi:hypothetical protein